MGDGVKADEFDTSDPELFFQGEELERRLDAAFRACVRLPPRDEAEAAIRLDIYQRTAPAHGRR